EARLLNPCHFELILPDSQVPLCVKLGLSKQSAVTKYSPPSRRYVLTAQADHLQQLRDLTSVDALRQVGVGSGVLQQVSHVQAVVRSPLLSLDDEGINEKGEKL
ncbi:MAG: hypothetical protein ACKPKO_62375, partial [Candidatus Fonsibacter sp.]